MSEKLSLPIGTTLSRFIRERQEQFTYASGELSQLLRDISVAAKVVNREVNRAGLTNILGKHGAQNVQGEEQQKLDVIANNLFIKSLSNGGEVCAIISEEDENITDTQNPHGKYVIAMDPLDGSSNIDVNVSIGTIFSIYRRQSPVGSPVQESDIFQKGTEQVGAGYTLYGSSTMLVYTTGHGVNGFTLEPSLGEFLLSHPDMKIPTKGKIFSINEGSAVDFGQAVKNYVSDCKKNKFKGRYIGSLVADFHRNLLKGGIYVYPSTKSAPNGKLRLLYECNALAFIAEQAGGKSSNGIQRTLEIEPTELHQRCPLYIGSKEMVERAESFIMAGENVEK
ncbi:class 1 fructose-bisphosphatase [Microscilla marina]|uniref:Fructose-1,6-bisphosphatase class 1 n=1 Tax=Microscilla marina ATCC 23134 TaxID=313606 RepID=A1ZHT8_MICM2|nr:class 1 fructose-bisphosphatase [Microscilla marina]EAY30095.1 fructose-1,6-bisphosphatase [Microscilla marina ATCC 23134]